MNSKFDLYLNLIASHQDVFGFVDSSECDSLLFSGLVGCVPGIEVNIYAAFNYSDGKWYRRPLAWRKGRECCAGGFDRTLVQRLKDAWPLRKDHKAFGKEFERGGSTISRDMLTGLAWFAWHNRRLDISERVVNYALKHWMKMGDGSPARILIMPMLLATFAWISYRLGGPSRWWLRWIPCDMGSKVDDFEAHLQVLHILLRSDLTGKLSKREAATLERNYKAQRNNPLFAYACGDYANAEMLLDNEKWWPSDRLPTSDDRKTNWLPMRDYGSDWEPSDQGRQHSGGDYLFVKWLLNR